MNCYVHAENEAVGTCTSCGKSICSECEVEMQGKLICRTCLSTGRVSANSDKDPNTAFLIELVGGFFGLLGIGYLYTGRTNDGVLRLIIWIIYMAIAGITISLLMAAFFIGLICLPFQLAIQIGVPLWSANNLKKLMASENSI